MANKKQKSTTPVTNKRKSAGDQSLNLLNATTVAKTTVPRINPASDLRKLSDSTKASTTPISFGKPSRSGSAKSSSNSSSISNGVAGTSPLGALSKLLGGDLLGEGFASLFSGLADVFGAPSKAAPLPLQRFVLPSSQEQTLYVDSGNNLTSSPPNASGPSTANSGAYHGAGANNQAAIVQAVRNALLTSSSLNDVIGEL